jgi:hypothetical protein
LQLATGAVSLAVVGQLPTASATSVVPILSVASDADTVKNDPWILAALKNLDLAGSCKSLLTLEACLLFLGVSVCGIGKSACQSGTLYDDNTALSEYR